MKFLVINVFLKLRNVIEGKHQNESIYYLQFIIK
jgi:hypothetical protein